MSNPCRRRATQPRPGRWPARSTTLPPSASRGACRPPGGRRRGARTTRYRRAGCWTSDVKMMTGRKISASAPSASSNHAAMSKGRRASEHLAHVVRRGPGVPGPLLLRTVVNRTTPRVSPHALDSVMSRPVPLLGQLGQRAVGVHLFDDGADGVHEALVVDRGVPVERDRERFVVQGVSDVLHRSAVRDVLVDRGRCGHHRVAAHAVAERQLIERVGVGVEGHDGRVIDHVVDRRPPRWSASLRGTARRSCRLPRRSSSRRGRW